MKNKLISTLSVIILFITFSLFNSFAFSNQEWKYDVSENSSNKIKKRIRAERGNGLYEEYEELVGRVPSGIYDTGYSLLFKVDNDYYICSSWLGSTLHLHDDSSFPEIYYELDHMKISKDATILVAIGFEEWSTDFEDRHSFKYINYNFYDVADSLFANGHWKYTNSSSMMSFSIGDREFYGCCFEIMVNDNGEIESLREYYAE